MKVRSCLARLGGSAILASMLVLSACNANVRRGKAVTVEVPQSYDMTIGAYKDNQYLLDGAVLSAPDLEAHFRYLEEQKELPRTVLLEDSKSAKVGNAALQEFASLQLSFNFTGYVLHKGKLTLMSAVAAKGKPASEDRQDGEHHHHQNGGFEGGGPGGNGIPPGGGIPSGT